MCPHYPGLVFTIAQLERTQARKQAEKARQPKPIDIGYATAYKLDPKPETGRPSGSEQNATP